jgi:predicted nucleotidyltransferase component of viral defense system
MNWEKSKALTALKRDFIKRFAVRNQDFFLTGGSALGIFYLEHRLSYDLDFFTSAPAVEWHLLENIVRGITADIHAECRALTASPDFHRYQIVRPPESEILDFVIERIPQIDEKKNDFDGVRVDTIREIMVNKICALIHRCELKDVLDLYYLQRHGYFVRDYLKETQRKESGLDPAMISFLLSRLKIDIDPGYLLAPLDLEDFHRFVDELRKEMAQSSFP